MKKVWILMLVAAVALVACPVFMAMAQDNGGGGGGKGGGKGGFGKGGFGGPPVTLTDDQTTTMKPKVDALTTAAKALNTAASDEKALGDYRWPALHDAGDHAGRSRCESGPGGHRQQRQGWQGWRRLRWQGWHDVHHPDRRSVDGHRAAEMMPSRRPSRTSVIWPRRPSATPMVRGTPVRPRWRLPALSVAWAAAAARAAARVARRVAATRPQPDPTH